LTPAIKPWNVQQQECAIGTLVNVNVLMVSSAARANALHAPPLQVRRTNTKILRSQHQPESFFQMEFSTKSSL
jgi:hypothetical protein